MSWIPNAELQPLACPVSAIPHTQYSGLSACILPPQNLYFEILTPRSDGIN